MLHPVNAGGGSATVPAQPPGISSRARDRRARVLLSEPQRWSLFQNLIYTRGSLMWRGQTGLTVAPPTHTAYQAYP